MTTTVVLPAFNEEHALGTLLEQTLRVLQSMPGGSRIVVVDDGSSDRTAEIAKRYAGHGVHLIAHERNRGLHEAVRSGLSYAAQISQPDDVIVTLDADNTHDPALIPAMVARLAEGNDVVIASRFARGGRMVGAPFIRHIYSLGARMILQTRFPIARVRDYTCGYRAYRAAILHTAYRAWGSEFINVGGFACMLNILLQLRAVGARVDEVPLVLRYDRKESPSKLRVRNTIKNTMRLVFSSHKPKELSDTRKSSAA